MKHLTRVDNTFIVNVIQKSVFLIVCVNAFLTRLRSWLTHSLSLKKPFSFQLLSFLWISHYFCYCMCLNTYAWLPLCVLIWKRDRVCVRDVYCTCTIKLYVNTLPHAHGLLIKNCTKRQRIDLFGINLWFVGPLAKLFCNNFRPSHVQLFIISVFISFLIWSKTS